VEKERDKGRKGWSGGARIAAKAETRDPRTDIGLTTEATESAETGEGRDSAPYPPILCVLCGSMSDLGGEASLDTMVKGGRIYNSSAVVGMKLISEVCDDPV